MVAVIETSSSFQFYDSPIKSMNEEDKKILKIISFNSMIVRLKGCATHFADSDAKFQFYDSPIKRDSPLLPKKSRIQAFQFYDSPIKRIESKSLKKHLFSFNSMIVRLKVLFIFLPPSFTIVSIL